MDDEFLSDLETLCKDANCVVALVPEPVQVKIAQFCVKHNTPLVTASYVSPGMKELHQAAEAAGIPILCEMGLDPGMVSELFIHIWMYKMHHLIYLFPSIGSYDCDENDQRYPIRKWGSSFIDFSMRWITCSKKCK
jgi:saccharopine dehydrogenase-like NADP-dependent oxidoreductase